MNALLISDLHESDHALTGIDEILKDNRCIGLVVFAGDLTNFGENEEYAINFLNILDKFSLPLVWVPGNNDFGDSYKVLQHHTKSVEGRIVEFENRKFTGVGGSPESWAGQYRGEKAISAKEIAGTILLSHVPPPGIVNLYKIDNADSKFQTLNPKKIQNPNNRIKQRQVSDLDIRNSDLHRKIVDFPVIHICGHIHHTWGISYIGTTKVVKLGVGNLGYYAIMNLQTLHVNFERMWR